MACSKCGCACLACGENFSCMGEDLDMAALMAANGGGLGDHPMPPPAFSGLQQEHDPLLRLFQKLSLLTPEQRVAWLEAHPELKLG